MDKSAPISYFFADPMTFSQQEWQAFGPRGSNSTEKANQFSLTAVFGSWENYVTNAYAICRGIVLVQPQTGNPGLVNLILRPFDQPFPGVKVKYFVYRGLRKGDFFDNDNKVLASGENTSDFIHKINAGFASFYTSRGQAVPDFMAKYMGYDPDNQPGTMLLDDLFFKQATYTNNAEDPGMAFELPLIPAGVSLGRFVDNGDFGMDVVLDYGDFREPNDHTRFVFDLDYARLWRAELEIWDTIGTGALRLRRMEQVLQFIDIVAFYGAHAAGGIVKARISGQWYNKTANDICTDLLGILYSKHRWYIYIQGDRTRSYNFYGNYAISDTNSNDLKKGYTANAISETIYRTDEWPVLIDEDARVHNEDTNSLYLQFTKTPNNPNAMFYAQLGNVVNAQHNNFCDAINLSLPDDVDGTPAEWTRPLQLTVPAIEESGNKYNIASFAMLFYQGREYAYKAGEETDEDDVTTPVYAVPNYFDEVFDGLDAVPLLNPTGTPLYSTLSNQRLKLISQYYNQTHYGIAAVQTTKVTDVIATDDTLTPLLKRVTYIAESVDTLTDAIAIGGRVNTGAALSSSAFSSASNSNTYQLPEPFYYERQLFTDGVLTITGLKLKATNGALPDRIMVGMTDAEHTALSALVNGMYNARLFLLDLFEDGNELISAEGTLYQKYKLGIVAEKESGALELFMPADEIIVYALDRYYYFTEEYSRYMPDLLLDINYLFVNEVI
ncbi:hypothetical protein [Pedobacter sp.]|uniref:hypothetical protein n=1 Tax=Pedobacter sp. TaxID=1411316 RepID=UPI00396CCCB4